MIAQRKGERNALAQTPRDGLKRLASQVSKGVVLSGTFLKENLFFVISVGGVPFLKLLAEWYRGLYHCPYIMWVLVWVLVFILFARANAANI